MFQFAAPYPGIQTISLLPNPQFSDTEALTASLSAQRATDGTLFTYVKTKGGRRKLSWTFRLNRAKGLEFREFLISYGASKIRVTDHNGRIWVGNFTNNPFELEADSGGPMVGDLRDNLQSITIEFEGVAQS